MEIKFKERLIKALRSDKYKQTRFRLRRGNCFCILGVVCDLIDPEKWIKDEYGVWHYRTADAILPQSIKRKIQLSSEEETKLMEWNDGDKLSFDQIANRLEGKCTETISKKPSSTSKKTSPKKPTKAGSKK